MLLNRVFFITDKGQIVGQMSPRIPRKKKKAMKKKGEDVRPKFMGFDFGQSINLPDPPIFRFPPPPPMEHFMIDPFNSFEKLAVVLDDRAIDVIRHLRKEGPIPFNPITPTAMELERSEEFWKARVEEQVEYIARYSGTRPEVIHSAVEILEYCQVKMITARL